MSSKRAGAYNIYILSLVTGGVAGVFALLFSWLLDLSTEAVSQMIHYSYDNDFATSGFRLMHHPGVALAVVLLPAAGGLLCGLLIRKFSPSSAGTGTDELIDSFHNKEGKMDSKVPLIKSIATVFTLSTGGSGGKEGPIAMIGAGIGSIVASVAKAGSRARRTLLLSGTAAGLGATFKAPLGGALTAAEMVYKEDIESDALIPCFISSVVAYLIYAGVTGPSHFLLIHDSGLVSYKELIFYILLGFLCLPFGWMFIEGFNITRRIMGRLNLSSALKPAFGGLIVGIISLVFFEVAGTGSDFLSAVADGKKPIFLGLSLLAVPVAFLIIAFLKIIATNLTIGTGGSAGIFGPSLFIGGMLGAAVGYLASWILPGVYINVGSYVVVGMGAFYAGVAKAPIAGIVMICEMTGSYSLLPPLIIVSIFTFILSKRFSIYKNQVENRFQSPAHLWDMKSDIMDRLKVGEKFPQPRNLATLHIDQSMDDVLKLSASIHAGDFVVKGRKGEFCGMLSLRKVSVEQGEDHQLPIASLVNTRAAFVEKPDSLGKAMRIMLENDYDKVAVVENGTLLGYIRSRDILHTYMEEMKQKK
ncbi:MAG: chloride channel protein [Bacteroidia bacterium]|nr:chloride channel protein [Bacteroidia bacterium]